MSQKGEYFLQPFLKRSGELQATDMVRCESEDDVFRHGRQMQGRVAGAVFYRIETSASGDQWTEVEVLATVGEVPSEAA